MSGEFVGVIHGDCLEKMAELEPEKIDAIVTDPPYGLGFMGKAWDHGVPGAPFWAAALRVAKPGAHLVAFGGSRTFHRLTVAIEDAGWEIRDCLMWLYGSGFPKSLDISKAIDQAAGAEREIIGYDASKARPNKENFAKRTDRQPTVRAAEGWKDNGATRTAPATDAARQWEGWGTALKPAWEPIILARKPLIGTVAKNILEHSTGALNIDGTRIGSGGQLKWDTPRDMGYHGGADSEGMATRNESGRWPANLILDEEAAALLDEQTGEAKSGVAVRAKGISDKGMFAFGNRGTEPDVGYGDTGGASRFFYTAKASRSERDEGLEQLPRKAGGSNAAGFTVDVANGIDRNRPVHNFHPTVKPLEVMRWLCRLVTPPGGLILDPFTGSGSTGCAALSEGFSFVGVELDPEFAEIARQRILHHGRQMTLGL